MATVTFIAHDGTQTTVDVTAGQSLLMAALNNQIKGIDGDCGGQCACATCHVYLDAPWSEKIPAPKANEDEMLNFTAERCPNSRLACQITLTETLDGMQIHMPAGQH